MQNKHCQRHNGPNALQCYAFNTLTQSTPLGLSISFNNIELIVKLQLGSVWQKARNTENLTEEQTRQGIILESDKQWLKWCWMFHTLILVQCSKKIQKNITRKYESRKHKNYTKKSIMQKYKNIKSQQHKNTKKY